MHQPLTRLLSIDPTSKGLAWAIFEGQERLIDWQTNQIESDSVSAFMDECDSLCIRFDPDVIVVENPRRSQRGSRAKGRIVRLMRYAATRGITIVAVSRDEVRKTFAASGTTKWEIAVRIAEEYPELKSRLPRRRKVWEPESDAMNVFDALSFALTAFRRQVDALPPPPPSDSDSHLGTQECERRWTDFGPPAALALLR